MGFLVYDIGFLVIFTAWVIWFLHSRKKNLKREGIIYLYRTRLGIKLIDYVGTKYKRILNILQYFAVATGFILMGSILWLLSFTVYTYIKFPEITDIVSAPPVIPLIPYFPSIFGLSSFFPPLYFTYWILALLVVAAVHEFSHGFFAKFHGLKIKSTGFAFLGPILGAFVEPDEKQMVKKGKFAQMSILSAGVFANIITALIFFLLLWAIFGLAFEPSGVLIYSYASNIVKVEDINFVNGNAFTGSFEGLLDRDLTEIQTDNINYLIPKSSLEKQLTLIEKGNQKGELGLFIDAPAIKNNITGVISKINDKDIRSIDDLSEALGGSSPGESILLETKVEDGVNNYEIILGENPLDKEKSFLGVHINSEQSGNGFRSVVRNVLFFRDSSVSYEEINQPMVFLYYLFWWMVMINFFVALFNMLPVGILDGGRFFYLTVLGITRSEKVTKHVYKGIFYVIMFIFLSLILAWLYALLI